VLFQGFLAIARNNQQLSESGEAWGYTLAPWAFLGFFAILLILWQVITGSWDVLPIRQIDMSGMAPQLLPSRKETKLKAAISWVLNAI